MFAAMLATGVAALAHSRSTVHADATEPENTEATPRTALTDSTFSLDEVVVTATRTPKLLKDVPVQTRLICRRDIERTDATNVQDLLQQEMPGVEFTYAMNQQVHMNLCGFGGQGILFLVDGERLAGETMDDVDFTRLDMAGVERIEFVKGASSALYGSNAGGGVINIITRCDTASWRLNANARLARHNAQRYGATLGHSRGKWANDLNVVYTTTDNYSVTSAANPQTRVFSTVYGDQTLNVKDRLIFTPCNELRLTGRAGYFYRTVSRTPESPDRYRDFSAGLRAHWLPTDQDQVDVSYSYDQYDKSSYYKLTGLDLRNYSNVQNTLRAVYSHSFQDTGILTLGADYTHDYLYKTGISGSHREQDCLDAFAQMDWNISEQWELVGALRYDYFSLGSENRLTPKLTARYRPRHDLTFRLGYGMGFRAPSLKERYYDFDMAGIWIVKGSPELKAETSHNINISMEWTKKKYNLTVGTYYNHISNKLTTGLPYALPGDPHQLYLDYLNLKSHTVCGAEATLQARWNKEWSARASYAVTAEMPLKDEQGNTINNQYLPARPHSLTARLDYTHTFSTHYTLDVALSGRFLSATDSKEYIDYYDIARGTHTVSYPAYTLWKLSTVHRIGKAVKLTLAIDNLLNYQPRFYYLNAPVTDGASLQLGLSIDIDRLW